MESFLINNKNWYKISRVDGQGEFTSQNAFAVFISTFVFLKKKKKNRYLCPYDQALTHAH